MTNGIGHKQPKAKPATTRKTGKKEAKKGTNGKVPASSSPERD